MHILSCILTQVLQLPLPGAEEKFIEEASGSCSQQSGAEGKYSIISSHQPTIWCPFLPNQICFIQFRACYLPLLYLSTNQNGILMLSSHRCIYNKSIPLFSIPTLHIQATKSVFISIMFIWRVARCVDLIDHQTYFCPCDASS